jgi:hypothetical protein
LLLSNIFAKDKSTAEATLELVGCHENSGKISAENAGIIARVCQNRGWRMGEKGLKIAQKFIVFHVVFPPSFYEARVGWGCLGHIKEGPCE